MHITPIRLQATHYESTKAASSTCSHRDPRLQKRQTKSLHKEGKLRIGRGRESKRGWGGGQDRTLTAANGHHDIALGLDSCPRSMLRHLDCRLAADLVDADGCCTVWRKRARGKVGQTTTRATDHTRNAMIKGSPLAQDATMLQRTARCRKCSDIPRGSIRSLYRAALPVTMKTRVPPTLFTILALHVERAQGRSVGWLFCRDVLAVQALVMTKGISHMGTYRSRAAPRPKTMRVAVANSKPIVPHRGIVTIKVHRKPESAQDHDLAPRQPQMPRQGFSPLFRHRPPKSQSMRCAY